MSAHTVQRSDDLAVIFIHEHEPPAEILSRTHRFHHHRRASTPIRAACRCGGRDGVQVLLLLLLLLLGLAGGGAGVGGVPDEHAVEKLDVCGFGYHGGSRANSASSCVAWKT
jgi:hypothetical protein